MTYSWVILFPNKYHPWTRFDLFCHTDLRVRWWMSECNFIFYMLNFTDVIVNGFFSNIKRHYQGQINFLKRKMYLRQNSTLYFVVIFISVSALSTCSNENVLGSLLAHWALNHICWAECRPRPWTLFNSRSVYLISDRVIFFPVKFFPFACIPFMFNYVSAISSVFQTFWNEINLARVFNILNQSLRYDPLSRYWNLNPFKQRCPLSLYIR